MNIEHIALWTNDLERSKEFYIEFFKGEAGKKYYNSKKNFESYFLKFQSGARLEIMRLPNVSAKNDNNKIFIGYAHLAFSVRSEEKVKELTETLRERGYSVVSEPRKTGDGYFESCVLDPDGNEVEITV